MSFYPTCNKEFQKNSKKFKKLNYEYFWKGREREKIKNKKIVPSSSSTTRNRKFQKKSKKIKKHHYGFFSSKNKLGKAEKEKKKNRSGDFLPDPL